MVTGGAQAFGSELKRWRTVRRFSQLELATRSDVSQRHLSFLETGRSAPSREMVIHLAMILDVPLRDRNHLLEAAGFAPVYPHTELTAPAMRQVRKVLEFILSAHEPNPAIVIDRRWDVVMSNEAAGRLTAALVDPSTAPIDGGVNVARLTFHPEGLRTCTVGWDATAADVLARLERDANHRSGDDTLENLLHEVLEYPGVAELDRKRESPTPEDLLLPVHYRTEALEVRLFSTIATLGAPFDITLEELRLETFFPADATSAAALDALARA
jgi:transcriptional regulator with XRE-family HTH domain